MLKKRYINLFLLIGIIISFILIAIGSIIIFTSEQKILLEANILEKVIEYKNNDKQIIKNNENIIKNNNDNSKIGIIKFNNGTKVSIYNNPTDEHLKLGAGKINNKAVLNKSGNNILLGHRDTVFKILKNIKEEDKFLIKTKESEIKYKVIKIYITEKEDPSPYQNTDDLIVTLITCYPFVYVGNAPKRYIVIAKAI